jgi:hypothetical protein
MTPTTCNQSRDIHDHRHHAIMWSVTRHPRPSQSCHQSRDHTTIAIMWSVTRPRHQSRDHAISHATTPSVTRPHDIHDHLWSTRGPSQNYFQAMDHTRPYSTSLQPFSFFNTSHMREIHLFIHSIIIEYSLINWAIAYNHTIIAIIAISHYLFSFLF